MSSLNQLHEQQLRNGLQELDIDFTEQQVQQLKSYLVLLSKWNQTHNLTAITEMQQMIDLHILDSLSVMPAITGVNLLDVGSGAGLPGLMIALFRPEVQITSIDTRGKKIQFQQLAATTLGLQNFQAIHSRVEEYQPAMVFDQIISRAFSSLENFINWTKHLLNHDGEWLAMKGQLPEEEIQALRDQFDLAPDSIMPLSVPNVTAARHLLTIKYKK